MATILVLTNRSADSNERANTVNAITAMNAGHTVDSGYIAQYTDAQILAYDLLITVSHNTSATPEVSVDGTGMRALETQRALAGKRCIFGFDANNITAISGPGGGRGVTPSGLMRSPTHEIWQKYAARSGDAVADGTSITFGGGTWETWTTDTYAGTRVMEPQAGASAGVSAAMCSAIEVGDTLLDGSTALTRLVIAHNAYGRSSYTADGISLLQAQVEWVLEDPPPPTLIPNTTLEPALWLDPATIADADGAEVTAWADVNGGATFAPNATGVRFRQNGNLDLFNGNPYVEFATASASLAATLDLGVGSWTVFAVFLMSEEPGFQDHSALLDVTSGTGSPFIIAPRGSGTGDTGTVTDLPAWFDGTWQEVGDGASASRLPARSQEIITWKLDATANLGHVYRRGSLHAPGAYENDTFATGHGFEGTTLLGGASPNGFEGALAELIVFQGALSDADRNDVTNYLRDKYPQRMWLGGGLTSAEDFFTQANREVRPYYPYAPLSMNIHLATPLAPSTDHLLTDDERTAWKSFYSKFYVQPPMGTAYEPPPPDIYIPPDPPPEADPRQETFRNRAGIKIEVWDKDDPNGTLLAVMARSRNRRWFEALNEPGGGSFEVHLDDPVLYDHPDLEAQGLDPKSTILKYGNIVRCYLDGVARFSFKIESMRVTTVGSGEKEDQWVEVSGRGVLALLEDAVVYPEYGFSPKSRGDQRLFTFVANHYESVIDDGSGKGYENFGWGWAAELKAQHDVVTEPWMAAPLEWPELGQNAMWIWDEVRDGSRLSPAPVGYVYFLKRFYLATDEDVAFFAACDDSFEMWLDGEPLMSNGGTYAFRETSRVDLKVTAGHHLIAVRCENVERPYGESPAGFVCMAAAIGLTETKIINEKHTLVHNADGGTFTLTFDGQTTAALPYNASRYDIHTALANLSNVENADIHVSQIVDPGAHYVRPGSGGNTGDGLTRYRTTIEWLGQYRGTNVPDLVANTGGLTRSGGHALEVDLVVSDGGLISTVEPAELIVLSDSTWRCLGYPETSEIARNAPPAFPPGAVMRFLLEEARVRGVQYADQIVRLHTDYRDNNGDEFGVVVDTAFDIGMDLLQVAQRLSETSVDIYMSPWLELSMWVERGTHKDQDNAEPYVELRRAKNLGRATFDDRGIIRNSLLLRTQDGWQERRVPDSETTWGRREAFLSLGNAPSEEQVGRTVDYAFSLTAQPNSSTVFEIPDTQKAQNESLPYKHFDVGDWIVAPDMHNIRRSRRVVGLGVSEDENGEINFSVEMSNPRDEHERRLERWLESIQLGTLRGSIASARAVDPARTALRGTVV